MMKPVTTPRSLSSAFLQKKKKYAHYVTILDKAGRSVIPRRQKLPNKYLTKD